MTAEQLSDFVSTDMNTNELLLVIKTYDNLQERALCSTVINVKIMWMATSRNSKSAASDFFVLHVTKLI